MNTRQSVLFATTASAFLAPVMASSINIALPAIGKEFALNAIALGWVASAYLLTSAAFVLTFGKLADIYGRRRVYQCGLTLFAAASVLCALAPSAALLIAFRAAQGVGAAMVFGTGIALLTSVYPANVRGKALGINVASTYAGLSLGPVIAGALTEYVGWRSLFWANAAATLLILAAVLLNIREEWAGTPGERVDWLGAAFSSATLIFIMIGVARLPKPAGIALICAGCAGLAAFVAWESRAAFPLLNMRLFRANRVFAFANLAALINYSATFAISFLLSLYLQYIKGLTPKQAGLTLIAQPAVMAILSPLCGRLSDRMSSRTLASSGMAIIVIGLGLLSRLTTDDSMTFLIAAQMLLGFGFALFSSPNTNAIMSAVEKPDYGVAAAALATMRSTGQAFSLGVAMLMFALFLGDVKLSEAAPAQFLRSLDTAFFVFAALCVIGVFASLARGKRLNNSHEISLDAKSS